MITIGHNNIILSLIALFLFSSISVKSEPTPGNEIFLPLPNGWYITDSVDQYPLLVIHKESKASLLVLRSTLEKEEAIRNAEELKPSVEMVVGDIIKQLPEAEVISNTGYFDESRVRFILEFNAADTSDNSAWFHRFSGYIYTLTDGSQLLFTLWGRMPVNEQIGLEPIKLMQSSFSYNGPHLENVFDISDKSGKSLIYGGVALVVLLTILFIRRNRAKIAAITKANDSNFWNCSCGRLNHGETEKCRRCGRLRQKT